MKKGKEMDTGNGHFEMLKTFGALMEGQEEPPNYRVLEASPVVKAAQKKFPNHGGLFTIGEKLELKGSLFRVKSIKPNRLVLKLLKRSA